MSDHDFAVIVAIGEYGYYSSLNGPVIVAEEFASWLRSGTGGNVPSDHVKVVARRRRRPWSNPFQARPTVDDVDTAFRHAVARVFDSNPQRNGRLYIYLVGHGITPTLAASPNLDDAALLMANADNGAAGLHIPGQPYANWFRNAKAFDEIVLIMDCCRDNRPEVAPRLPPFPRTLHPDASSVRFVYAYSTQFFQKSYERPIKERKNRSLPVFSVALLEGLEGAARDETGRITATSLRDYVDRRLGALQESNQRPTFSIQGNLEFGSTIPSSASLRVEFVFHKSLIGQTVQLKGPGNQSWSLLIPSTSPSLTLPRGLYKATLANRRLEKYFEIYGVNDQSVEFDDWQI